MCCARQCLEEILLWKAPAAIGLSEYHVLYQLLAAQRFSLWTPDGSSQRRSISIYEDALLEMVKKLPFWSE